jgi:hypothetical protein
MFRKLSDYRTEAGQKDLEELETPVLIVELGSAVPPQREFRTTTERASWIPPLTRVIVNPSVCVVPLEKSNRNPYTSFIFVGRGSSSDIILRRSSVSKRTRYSSVMQTVRPGGCGTSARITERG